MPKKKKKRKGHYHTGDYVSIKTGQICSYRSGWEEKYLTYLDTNPDVLTFEYEPFAIEYVSNKKTGKIRKYYPDVLVTYVDGRIILVEIKPLRRMHQAKIQKKTLAAGDWARLNNVEFKIVTEVELKALGLL